MKRNACQKCAFAVHDDNPHCGLRGFTSSFNVEWCESENDKAPNGYELQEDGYFSWVKKKKEYPKTYEECCTILGFHYDHYLTYDDEKNIPITQKESNFIDSIDVFAKLIICRDAYWKIAGGEMGLGKPWKPYWNTNELKYIIYYENDKLWFNDEISRNTILTFPTEEMRDVFYEAFKEMIEECKELL